MLPWTLLLAAAPRAADAEIPGPAELPPEPVDEAPALDLDELPDDLEPWLSELAARAEEGTRRARALRFGLELWSREGATPQVRRRDEGVIVVLSLDLDAVVGAAPAPAADAPAEVDTWRTRCLALAAEPRRVGPLPRHRLRALVEALGCGAAP